MSYKLLAIAFTMSGAVFAQGTGFSPDANFQFRQGNKPGRDGYIVTLSKNAEKSIEIVEISNSRKKLVDWKSKEVIFISKDFTVVQPDFRTAYKFDEESGKFKCMQGALRTDADNKRNDYNPCDSLFMKDDSTGKDVAATAMLGVATAGLGFLTGTKTYSVTLNEEKIRETLTELNIIAAVQEYANGSRGYTEKTEGFARKDYLDGRIIESVERARNKPVDGGYVARYQSFYFSNPSFINKGQVLPEGGNLKFLTKCGFSDEWILASELISYELAEAADPRYIIVIATKKNGNIVKDSCARNSLIYFSRIYFEDDKWFFVERISAQNVKDDLLDNKGTMGKPMQFSAPLLLNFLTPKAMESRIADADKRKQKISLDFQKIQQAKIGSEDSCNSYSAQGNYMEGSLDEALDINCQFMGETTIGTMKRGGWLIVSTNEIRGSMGKPTRIILFRKAQ